MLEFLLGAVGGNKVEEADRTLVDPLSAGSAVDSSCDRADRWRVSDENPCEGNAQVKG